jgi:uncharacterized protein
MVTSTLVRIVNYCTRYAWVLIIASLLAASVSVYYAATHFAISTDVNKLISPYIDWRQRELAFEQKFPGRYESTLVVVDAPTGEMASQATRALAARLTEQPKLFPEVFQPMGGEFIERHGLLFLPTSEVAETTKGLAQARQIIGVLSTDPSLRGLTEAMSFGFLGVQRGMLPFDNMLRPMSMAADTLDNVLAGRPAFFSWQDLLRGRAAEPGERRQLIQVQPTLDFAALEPGKEATDAIRQAAVDLKLAEQYGATVRLTGPVPIADEEFATVRDGALLNGIATVVLVLAILWIGLRSGKIILAVAINLFVGLSITFAVGLALVGSLNLISIAFAVLFVGLGVDFGIQMSTRYRAERHANGDLRSALAAAVAGIGIPLTLAAAAVAAGFLSFLPTDYRGVSELGQIAGVGMLIAYLSSITLLPALISVLNPPGEPEAVGFKALAPADRFIDRHRRWVVIGTIGVTLALTPLLYFLRFDFNPINLRSPHVESIATYLDLRRDQTLAMNGVNVLAKSPEEAAQIAQRLAELPTVARVMTAYSLVPEDQEAKLALIKTLGDEVEPALSEAPEKPPTDEENVEALRTLAEQIAETAQKANAQGPAAEAAKRLIANLNKLADGDKSLRDRAEATFTVPLKVVLSQLRSWLRAGPVTLETLPAQLTRQWIATNGMARVEAVPKGDPTDNEMLRTFARSVLAIYPEAVDGPITILRSGETIVRAFIEAGAWALVVITFLLWLTLRRIDDVLLTLIPLGVACLVTLQMCVLFGIPLNFANIIALPLLLGLGVAFTIYFTMAWREGQTNLLQSSLTRAVISSALTTAVAFGSLWLSNHPGTSSMGKLLAIALLTTLAAAVLFQPALLGRPRELRDP